MSRHPTEQEWRLLECEHKNEWLEPDPLCGLYCTKCGGLSQYDVKMSGTHWRWDLGKDETGHQYILHDFKPDVITRQ